MKPLESIEEPEELKSYFEENQIVLHKEMFQPASSQSKLVFTSAKFLDFGYCDYLNTSGEQEVVVYNKLPCKLVTYWTIVDEQNQSPVFQVRPQKLELNPLGQQSFSITFHPTKPSYYYYQMVQFFAVKQLNQSSEQIENMFKTARSITKNGNSTLQKFTLKNTRNDLDIEELIPSLSGYISCVGHSFNPLSQPFIPIVSANPSSCVF